MEGGTSSLRAKVLEQLKEDIQVAKSLYDSADAAIQGTFALPESFS